MKTLKDFVVSYDASYCDYLEVFQEYMQELNVRVENIRDDDDVIRVDLMYPDQMLASDLLVRVTAAFVKALDNQWVIDEQIMDYAASFLPEHEIWEDLDIEGTQETAACFIEECQKFYNRLE